MPSYSPAQDGWSVAGGWDEASAALAVSGASPFPSLAGIVWQASGQALLSGQVALERVSGAGPAVVSLALVPEGAPSDYGLSALPGTRGEQLLAEAEFADPVTLLVFGATPVVANEAACAAGWSALQALTAALGWSGRLALTVSTDIGGTLEFAADEGAGTAPALVTLESGGGSMALTARQKAQNRKDLAAGKTPRNKTALSALDLSTVDGVYGAEEQAVVTANRLVTAETAVALQDLGIIA